MKNACKGVFHLFGFGFVFLFFGFDFELDFWEEREKGGDYDTPPSRPVSNVRRLLNPWGDWVEGTFFWRSQTQQGFAGWDIFTNMITPRVCGFY